MILTLKNFWEVPIQSNLGVANLETFSVKKHPVQCTYFLRAWEKCRAPSVVLKSGPCIWALPKDLHYSRNDCMRRIYNSEVCERVPLLVFLHCQVELKIAKAILAARCFGPF